MQLFYCSPTRAPFRDLRRLILDEFFTRTRCTLSIITPLRSPGGTRTPSITVSKPVWSSIAYEAVSLRPSDRGRSGDLAFFRRTLCQLSYRGVWWLLGDSNPFLQVFKLSC